MFKEKREGLIKLVGDAERFVGKRKACQGLPPRGATRRQIKSVFPISKQTCNESYIREKVRTHPNEICARIHIPLRKQWGVSSYVVSTRILMCLL